MQIENICSFFSKLLNFTKDFKSFLLNKNVAITFKIITFKIADVKLMKSFASKVNEWSFCLFISN